MIDTTELWKAKPTHKSKSGRTGMIRAKQLSEKSK